MCIRKENLFLENKNHIAETVPQQPHGLIVEGTKEVIALFSNFCTT